ncbi:response regulator transcription factor, partial [Enorma massiliensis]|uniref:response regulator transcription factor n=1 Tax=Enorma massiliensis TaxID=1472761 RepID=UPI003A8C909A
YCVGRGKLAGNIGFILGLAVGIATVQALPAHPAASGYAALAIVACTVLAALFLLPFDNESEAPGIRTLVPVEKSDLEFPEEVDLARKCQTLIDRYKLSPRESEVLGYIVKGRNARHVADRLCISESTAKTHISNIYRKTNVHSQQELLDIIEEL